jgi:glutathione peroxidase|tara:strand:+ start:13 stop:561 length:549 start_codon:yes stop_codon:yes gene_type:complete
MKNLLIFGLTIIMIFFKNSSHAEYEKIFYDFKINSITGDQIDLKDFKGKPILIVNTASYCGFTKQYNDMQELWEKYRDRGLIVLGVPSNSFNQEKSDNSAVKEFCEVNFNINFPLTEITDVKGDNAHEIYKWAKANYGKSAVPKWNFYKILINKEGKIEDTYASLTSPTSNKITKKIENLLN